MRAFHLSKLSILLCATPLFFYDQTRWTPNIPPEINPFAHVGYFAVLAAFFTSSFSLAGRANQIVAEGNVRWWHFPRLGSTLHRSYLTEVFMVLLVALLAGALVEVFQPFFNRKADVGDIGTDMVGALMGVVIATKRSKIQSLLLLVSILLAGLTLVSPSIDLYDRAIARKQFPMLGDFESPFEYRRWSNGTLTTQVVRSGNKSLLIKLMPGRYSGTTLLRSFGDWGKYHYLEMSIYNPENNTLNITISIRDRENFARGGNYDDRYNGKFSIRPGWNDLHISIKGIRNSPENRTLNLSDLSEMAIYTVNLARSRIIYLDRVRIIR